MSVQSINKKLQHLYPIVVLLLLMISAGINLVRAATIIPASDFNINHLNPKDGYQNKEPQYACTNNDPLSYLTMGPQCLNIKAQGTDQNQKN